MKSFIRCAIYGGLGILLFSPYGVAAGFDTGRGQEKLVDQVHKSDPSDIPDVPGIPIITVFKITPNGDVIVNPELRKSTSTAYYQFSPDAAYKFTFNCPSTRPGLYNLCWNYMIGTDDAGHHHTPDGNLALFNPVNMQPLPYQVCQSSISTSTAAIIGFATPVYAALIYGQTTITGACVGAENENMQSRITGLEDMSPEAYFLVKPAFKFHPKTNFATEDTIYRFKRIAWDYYEIYGSSTSAPMLVVMDMSLPWGGRYNAPANESDLPACYTEGGFHTYHRYGRQVDVRAWNMTQQQQNCLAEIACRYQAASVLETGYAAKDIIPLSQDLPTANIAPFDKETFALDAKYPRMHLNFVSPYDDAMVPPDDSTSNCPAMPPTVSACPAVVRHDKFNLNHQVKGE